MPEFSATSSAFSAFRNNARTTVPWDAVEAWEEPFAPRERVIRSREERDEATAAAVMKGSDLLRSLNDRPASPALATRIASLDELSNGGLARGSMIELTGERSSGRFSIAMAALAAATNAGEPSALVDLGDHLDPRGAEAAGVELVHLLWLRPQRLKDALQSAEMVLTAGFGLVVLDLGLGNAPVSTLQPGAWVRLSRAAEAQKAVLLLISSQPLHPQAVHSIITARMSGARWARRGGSPALLTGLSVGLEAQHRKGRRRRAHGALTFSLRGE
jgi:hypothetical protein